MIDPRRPSPHMPSSAPAPPSEDRDRAVALTAAAPPRLTDWLRIALPVAVIAALVGLAWHFGYFNLKTPDQLDAATDKVENLPWLAPIFVLLYAGLATLAAPVSPLAYGAGALFGVTKGSLLVWLGSMLGASAGYFLARSALAGPARRLLGRFHEKLGQLREGKVFLTTLRLQLLPVLPFGIFNYAAGVMRLPFVGFSAGTGLGIVPGTIAAVYVGDRLVAGLQTGNKSAFVVAAIVVAAMFGLSFVPTLVTKIQRRA